MSERFPHLFGGLAVIAVALVLGSMSLAGGIRDRDRGNQTVTVTGSAKRPVEADVIVWRASLTSQQATPAAASSELAGWNNEVKAFLKDAGIHDDELQVDPISTSTVDATDKDGNSTGKVVAYRLVRSLEIRSKRVGPTAAVIERSVGLLDRGIPLTGDPPEYLYSQLAKVRPELLVEATKDAKSRGARLVEAAGGHLGRLRGVRVGVFQITARDSTDVSDEGVYDTQSRLKDITAVVRLTFSLKD